MDALLDQFAEPWSPRLRYAMLAVALIVMAVLIANGGVEV
jgi:hypothetical protein